MTAPIDLSAYLNSSLGDLSRILEAGTISTDSRKQLNQFTALIIERVLTLLRTASRSQIIEESAAFSGFFGCRLFEQVRERQPEVVGAWETLSDLLHEAGRKSDVAAVDSILSSYAGMPRKILEMLAAVSDEQLSRSELRQQLKISESYLSHVLREMDEAALVYRDRAKRKGVVIRLGPTGRDVVMRRIYPGWIDYLIEVIESVQGNRAPLDATDIESTLLDRGAPSPLVAKRIAEALYGNHSTFVLQCGIEFKRREQEVDPHYDQIASRLDAAGRTPLSQFAFQ